MNIESFHHNEVGYVAWRKDHPQGFILNHFGGTNPAFNVLHRSDCCFLQRNVDEGARTVVEKWCSDSDEALRQHANTSLGQQMWKECGICFRNPRPTLAAPIAPVIVPTPGKDAVREREPIWVAGEAAVWVGSGYNEWKQKVTQLFRQSPPSMLPQWLDIEFRFLEHRIFRKDIDNLITPILESAQSGAWIERGFQWLGSVTARKVIVTDPSQVGVLVTPRIDPPELALNRTGVLIEAPLSKLDASSVKWVLYDSAFDLYRRCPSLRFAPQSPLSIEIRVTIDDAGRRKSIKDLLKPCIDALEPILGHPENLLPEPRVSLQRRLAPQDEMILFLSFHVRGGSASEISALITSG